MRAFSFIILALAVLVWLTPDSALATKWVQFNGFFKKSPARFYIDFDSVHSLPNNQVFVWLRLEETKPLDGIYKTLIAKKFDCNNRKAIGVEMIFFMVGKEKPETFKKADVLDIPPKSAYEDAYRLACTARASKANKLPRPPR